MVRPTRLDSARRVHGSRASDPTARPGVDTCRQPRTPPPRAAITSRCSMPTTSCPTTPPRAASPRPSTRTLSVGLVHGDMEVIDAAGETIRPSFFDWTDNQPSDGRVLGRLLARNFISGGASTFRGDLLPALHPIAADAAYPDWWIAACIASVAEIRHERAVSNRYRYHGANMGLGAGVAEMPHINRRELSWRRWMMWHLVQDHSVTIADVANAVATWRAAICNAASGDGRGAGHLLERDPVAAASVLADGARDHHHRRARRCSGRSHAIPSTVRSPSTWTLRCSEMRSHR